MLHQFTREHGLNTQVLARMLRISTFEIMALHCAFSHHPDSSYRGDLIDQTRSDSATQIDQLLLNLRRDRQRGSRQSSLAASKFNGIL